MEALVDDLGWRSAEMLKTYDHAITRAELRQLLASSVRQMVEDAPRDAASLLAVLRGGVQARSHGADADVEGGDVLTLSDEARQTMAWIEALDAAQAHDLNAYQRSHERNKREHSRHAAQYYRAVLDALDRGTPTARDVITPDVMRDLAQGGLARVTRS